MRIRIMSASDYGLLREGLKLWAEAEREFEVTEEAETGEECMARLNALKGTSAMPKVLLLDSLLPGMRCTELLRKLKEAFPRLGILLLPMWGERESLKEIRAAGVDGLLTKSGGSAELKKALSILLEKGTYFPKEPEDYRNEPKRSDRGAQSPASDIKLRLLTEREKEVLGLTVRGMSNKEIAAALTISERTVKNHMVNIFRKLNVSDRTQAAVFALWHGYGTDMSDGRDTAF